MSDNQKLAATETGSVSSKASTKSATTGKSASRPTRQKEQLGARPTRPTRSLRERVLARTASARSSISEDTSLQSPPPLPQSLPPSLMDISNERVCTWDQEEIPPRPIQSDDELSEGSSISERAPSGRRSMLFTTSRRTGVEMDAATKLANETLLKAKEAIEAAGNMKKECKAIALDSLQVLYETVLSLSDSRSRHKHNLEKERARHAQELVRVERAHNKQTAELLKDLNQRLSEARSDISGNLEETRAIRSWLGYETQEPYRQISEIAEMTKKITAMERSIGERSHTQGTGQRMTDIGPLINDHQKMTSQLDHMTKQLDDMRRTLDKNFEMTKQLQLWTNHDKIGKGMTEVKEAILQAEKNLSQTIAEQPTPTPQVGHEAPPKGDLMEQLQPITEKLEAVSSELRTMREARNKTPPPATSLGTEIALAELVKTATQTAGKATYAQIAQKPRPPRPNHTLIVSATDPDKTGDKVIDSIRAVLDLQHTGAKIDKVRKARNHKIILSCSTKDDLTIIKNKLKTDNGLKAEIPKTNNPLAIVKDVLTYNSDADIVKFITSQNAHLLEGIPAKDVAVRVRYRKKARNPLECHVVLELSPEVHKRFIDHGKIYIDLQRRPIEDQSPLVQCAKCLGFGHTKTICREADQLCSYCGGVHSWEECSRRTGGGLPSCKNCQRANNKNNDHIAFSGDCPEKRKWDSIARSRITYC
ncbi:uncharacterized protein LOC123870511 [Maniola jurtina]|uniref:uncharacterized protein LOC123870511 n=1 Tax=Maniola jurtina TaxID=191418 RepID=UPI001E68CDFF|nr:uncharacterized protein LOC123870511 [Maniola jurtina]